MACMAIDVLLLREFKDAYFMARIPTRSFWANATYLETVLWAYDLVLAFQFLCLPQEIQHWNIATLRRELWWLPARYPEQEMFTKIQAAASRIKSII
jgi:hypothetical protein